MKLFCVCVCMRFYFNCFSSPLFHYAFISQWKRNCGIVSFNGICSNCWILFCLRSLFFIFIFLFCFCLFYLRYLNVFIVIRTVLRTHFLAISLFCLINPISHAVIKLKQKQKWHSIENIEERKKENKDSYHKLRKSIGLQFAS